MDTITGFHAIEEKIKALQKLGAPFDAELLYAAPGPRVKTIISAAKSVGIPCKQSSAPELDAAAAALPPGARDHRGAVLIIRASEARTDIDLGAYLAALDKQDALAVVLDGITDPHNMGAILRSCDQFGADIVITGTRYSAKESAVIARSSAGASEWVPRAAVPNISRALAMLKSAGFWIYGTDAKGTPLANAFKGGRIALVMGSEGKGVRRLTAEQCDVMLSIPARGKIDSFNVSVACGIFLYEIRRADAAP